MYGWRTRLVFYYYPVTVSEQILPHVNIRISLPIKEQISAHRNANSLLEDLVSKDYIYIVYKKGKYTLNVCFRVLVWGLTKYLSYFPITKNLYFRVHFLFKKQLPMVWKSRDFNFLWEIVVYSVEKSYVLRLSIFEKSWDFKISKSSL